MFSPYACLGESPNMNQDGAVTCLSKSIANSTFDRGPGVFPGRPVFALYREEQMRAEHRHENEHDGDQREIPPGHALGSAHSRTNKAGISLREVLMNSPRTWRRRFLGRCPLRFFTPPEIVLVDGWRAGLIPCFQNREKRPPDSICRPPTLLRITPGQACLGEPPI